MCCLRTIMFQTTVWAQIQHHTAKLLTPCVVNCILFFLFSHSVCSIFPFQSRAMAHKHERTSSHATSFYYLTPSLFAGPCFQNFLWAFSLVLSALWDLLLNTRDLAQSPEHEKQGYGVCEFMCVCVKGVFGKNKQNWKCLPQLCSILSSHYLGCFWVKAYWS